MDTKTDIPDPQEENRSQTVLVIDDDSFHVNVVISFLGELGLHTVTESTGEEGLIKARQARPDLILLDVQMPGIGGYETCRRLKADAETREIPVLFMSGQAEVEDKVEGFTAGGVDYLAKPFHPREFSARVMTQLKIQRQAREAGRQAKMLARAHDLLRQEMTQRSRLRRCFARRTTNWREGLRRGPPPWPKNRPN